MIDLISLTSGAECEDKVAGAVLPIENTKALKITIENRYFIV
jgi:hypothetical protein